MLVFFWKKNVFYFVVLKQKKHVFFKKNICFKTRSHLYRQYISMIHIICCSPVSDIFDIYDFYDVLTCFKCATLWLFLHCSLDLRTSCRICYFVSVFIDIHLHKCCNCTAVWYSCQQVAKMSCSLCNDAGTISIVTSIANSMIAQIVTLSKKVIASCQKVVNCQVILGEKISYSEN